jgi:hypothetical protein
MSSNTETSEIAVVKDTHDEVLKTKIAIIFIVMIGASSILLPYIECLNNYFRKKKG